VVLAQGDLPRAVRASMSLPVVFPPVEIDGRLLVDGALSDNVPTGVARDLGADLVIAVDVSAPPKELNGNHLGYVGRVVDAAMWKEEHPQYRFALKSTGWGDPSFAGYYPACRSVLGFWDAMEGVADGSELTYLVIGWYSDPARDLLRLSPFKEQPEVSAKHTLCHGGVINLTWQGDKQRYAAAAGGATKRVAIGSSAAEALTAPSREAHASSARRTSRRRLESYEPRGHPPSA